MQIRTTPLLSPSIGTQRTLTSFHFGPADTGRKIYLQAALHADETPAMLAAFVLKQRLAQLDADGRLAAEIVLVPVANPVGLNHHLLGQFIGRFDLASGRNFNRGFLPLAEIAAQARDRLGDDGERNRAIVRECVGAALDEIAPRTEFDALQLALLKLSLDAEVVIDLHCSLEAVMHVYTSDTAYRKSSRSRVISARRCRCSLRIRAGTRSTMRITCWGAIAAALPAGTPMAAGTVAVTVECRGQRDVTYDYAERDADALVDYLVWRGAVQGEAAAAARRARHAARRQRAVPCAGERDTRAPRGDRRDDSRRRSAVRYRRSADGRDHDDLERHRRRVLHASRDSVRHGGCAARPRDGHGAGAHGDVARRMSGAVSYPCATRFRSCQIDRGSVRH